MKNYVEKLKDPRWQKKRLEVFSRAEFKCQCCGDPNRTLHVHHLRYSGGEPWEANLLELECLCEVCHEFRTDFDALYERSTAPTRECWKHYCEWEDKLMEIRLSQV